MTLQPPLVSNGPPLFSNRQHFPKPQIMLRMAFVEGWISPLYCMSWKTLLYCIVFGSLFVLYELLYCVCIERDGSLLCIVFVLYELEDTRNHYQLPSSPKGLYPFNSFHNAALGGFLYFPQKGSYLQQTLNLNRFLNPITEHPIQVPNGVDL